MQIDGNFHIFDDIHSVLCFTFAIGSLSAGFGIKELSPREDIDKGELYHLEILERNESHGIKDFDLREILENMHEHENKWGYDVRNYTGVPLTHNKNLTCRIDQKQNKSSINFPQKQNVSVRNNTYQYFMHDKPFMRSLLKLKNNMSEAGNKYMKCLENGTGLSWQAHLAELQRFQTEEKIYEYSQVEKSVNNGSSVSPLRRIPPSVRNICNKYRKIS
ncbi:hypothetical protein HPG69_013974 [Diceros bicornis minor]|uniref:Uncharacterized protein n=1 Tax=Diceros bicornis minor TaxID=77932 RepID=A0A7J7EMM2_DICBM|nr:hypothetical protein HPG69_013974 [Diceros bicornis minor]